MNIMHGCRLKDDNSEADMIIIRVFGDFDNPVADRKRELLNMRVLHKAGCGQPLYCRFINGIAYRYNPGTVLNQDIIDDKAARYTYKYRYNTESMLITNIAVLIMLMLLSAFLALETGR